MKKTLLAVMFGIALCGAVNAKPGHHGGARGSFSAPSSVPHSSPGPVHPIASPSPQKGSFSAAPAPNQKGSFSAPTQTTTRTTTLTRTYSSRYVSPGGYYGGWGYGYHYNNGLMTGLIIGSMMHPYGTIMYTGPGMYYNNAVLYPDGRVVNQQGYLVGTYAGGQFNPVQNGPMVAQPVPADAGAQQPVQPQQPQVIYVEKPGPTPGEVFGYVMGGLLVVVLLITLFGMVI